MAFAGEKNRIQQPGINTVKQDFSGSGTTDERINQVAQDVISGKYGNGADRAAALTAAGYDADAVQAKVNEIYAARGTGTSGATSSVTVDEAGRVTSKDGTYTTPTLPSATPQYDYINTLYKLNQEAEEQALKSAYEKNTAALDYEASQIPQTYNTSANQAAANAAIQRANFNESANATGVNTGAGSQANLSMNNAAAANVNAIRMEQAKAVADIENQRAQLTLEYQNAIKDAIAQNNVNRAQALYEEAQRVDDSLTSTAANQANLDWTAWAKMYAQ